MFASKTYLQRRSSLKKNFKEGILLFLGNDESPINYASNTYHFRQDSTFLYYFGINTSGLSAIIDIDENKEIIFGDEMTIDDLVWMGQLETLKEKSLKAGISTTLPSTNLADVLRVAANKNRKVHFLPPYRSENKIKLFNLLQIDPGKTKEAASAEFIKAVVTQRSVKTAEEIAEIERAVNISVEMQKLAIQISKPGMTESEIAAAIHHVAAKNNCVPAYPIILTTHGEILHNANKSNILKEGDLILNDSGAETALGYCGDLTRTFPVSPKFTSKQKDIYEIVLYALNMATSSLAPGIKYRDVHFLSCKSLIFGLKDIGLMKGNVEDALHAGAHTMFFQCGTGHMMGMDVHDMEDLGEEHVGYSEDIQKETELFGLKSLRLGKELQAGYVLTVEPGIYFNPFLIDKWQAEKRFDEFINYQVLEKYRDFRGIRLEDNFLITGEGYQLLGNHLAKSVEEIEEMRMGVS